MAEPAPPTFLASLFGASADALAAIRSVNFARTLDLVFDHHPFYRRRFAEMGLTRDRIGGLADLPRLPVTTKQNYVAAPEDFRLPLADGPAEERILWDVMYTTGSSGVPTPFYSTTSDYYAILLASRRMLELRGVGAADIIANLNPMTVFPNGAYNRTLHAAATLGIPIVSALPGNPSPYFTLGRRLDEVVALIERSRATILWGISSYVGRVVARAQVLRADFSAVRLAFLSGEATSERLRGEILAGLARMGATAPRASVSYGHTETQTGMVECRPGSGYHNSLPESFYWEIVDPATQAPVPDGTPGLVLLSHLDRRGTVLLRYALGDISVKESGPCPHCGALGERFTLMPRRADNRVKIKGMLVDVESLIALLDAQEAIADYVALVERERPQDESAMDALRILVTLAAGWEEEALAVVAAAVKRATGITPVIERQVAGPLRAADHANKERKFIDRR